MAQPFIGEIRMFGGSFPPNGWAFCDGQLMPIAENDALFTLIGTTYGGDGQETFGLPNLCGRLPMHAGQGPGLSQNYQIGEMAGVEQVTLTTQQIPVHNHPMLATNQNPVNSPSGAQMGIPNAGPVGTVIFGTDAPVVGLNTAGNGIAGGSQPHENMHPYLTVSFIISLFGVFPTQN
eukprot:gene23307-23331_t